ncbi:site-specific integrase [Pinibacter soli]|uniref:Site-specific integrase n=1 Tax=Pinibacter soli TaxID=3044211 RepID=A0ABT6R753_9BACT|nr:site-specific integrase [Pinibacter soli]MDI3318398.1 site-specific integrase [Pinibacter soli]
MNRSFGLLFFPRKSRKKNEVEADIYLRITVDGRSVEISTKRQCDLQKWNYDTGRLNGKTEDAKLFNQYLDTLQQRVFEAKRQLIELNRSVTAENIKSLILGIDVLRNRHTIVEVFQHHNEQMESLVGQEYAKGTLQLFQRTLSHTKAFLQARYHITDMDISELNYEFICEYEFWLKSVRKCDHNSALKYLSNFRKIVNRCIRNGWLQKDPFIGFNMSRREVERVALTETQLKTLGEKKFSIERLSLVRDIFLFSCFSGLAYADVKKLDRSEIITGVDGEQWIDSKRQKTKVTARIPLLPPAVEILKRYIDHPQCIRTNALLPVFSNQKMNAYLKEIADLCGISKNLTFHIARHTFATTVTLSNGVPIETVAKMLGHRNLKTTQHYARILDKKIIGK